MGVFVLLGPRWSSGAPAHPPAQPGPVQIPFYSDVFEPAGDGFAGRTSRGDFLVTRNGFRVVPPSGAGGLDLHWSNSTAAQLSGTGSTRGARNYYNGSSRSQWRTAIPTHTRIRAAGLYPGVDADYYFSGQFLEFDLIIQPGADPRTARLEWSAPSSRRRWAIDPDGGLRLHAQGAEIRLRPPQAYQWIGEARTTVACRYHLDAANAVTFELGDYDKRRELIIDPVVEYLTYMGGDHQDLVQAVGIDSAGNVIVAGVTNSTNFPGLPANPSNATSIFVAKLDPTGSSLLYTTILGSYPGGNPAYSSSRVGAIAVSPAGEVFLTGTSYSDSFPFTPGAWNNNLSSSFAAKLDSSGQLQYATSLGVNGMYFYPQRIQARNGVLYLAGTTSQQEFYGTPDVYQRSTAGNMDFFVIALAPDGSGPLWITALGGSGAETLRELLLTPEGNVMLAGITTSADFPLTAGAWPVESPDANHAQGLIAVLDSAGSHLIYSSLLGIPELSSAAMTPEGDYVLAGRGMLPDSIAGSAPVFSPPTLSGEPLGFVARFAASTHQPLWITRVQYNLWGLTADAGGNLYWLGYSSWASGGSLPLTGSFMMTKLSAGGKQVLFLSRVADNSRIALGPGGRVALAGYVGFFNLPTTPGALQPKPDPAPSYGNGTSGNQNEGWVSLLNLTAFTDFNFFLRPTRPTLTWRIGQPLPADVTIPLMLSGEPQPLTVRSSNPDRLIAEYSDGQDPSLRLAVQPSQTTPGTFQERVTIESPIPEIQYSVPVTLEVKPSVDFAFAQSELQIKYRQGQNMQGILPASVPINPSFGGENFTFQAVSSDRAFYVWVDNPYQGTPQLRINAGDLAPGVYQVTVTVTLQGLQNPSHELHLRVEVQPAATISVSKSSFRILVTKGQPFQPDESLVVSSSVAGAEWNLFVGTYMSWMSFSQTTTKTPGAVRMAMDTSAASVGVYPINVFITGEDKKQIQVVVSVVVTSGAPLDVTPASVDLYFMRNTGYLPPYQQIAIVTPAVTGYKWSSGESWVLPQNNSALTQSLSYVQFDSSLPEGVRHGTLTIEANGATRQIPLTWRLYDKPTLTYSTEPLRFTYQIGGPEPAPQQVQITCPTLTPGSFYAGRGEYTPFLEVSQSTFVTPGYAIVKVAPAGLKPGTYQTSVSISGAYPDFSRYPSIPVTFEVLADPNAPMATLDSIVNAASLMPGTVSPGEILILSGSGLGPGIPLETAPDGNGRFPLQVSGIAVFFDEVAAPILSASAKQLKVVAPFGLADRSATAVSVEVDGKRTQTQSVQVSLTNPSLFTSDASGTGLAAAENESEDGIASVHGLDNPASPGSIVVLHATGMGSLKPPAADGQLINDPPPALEQSVKVYVGGREAQILSATAESGKVAGAARLRVRLPGGLDPGQRAVIVVSADNPSPAGVTLAIR